jgi:transcriptional regulator with XRE-family HTH domain
MGRKPVQVNDDQRAQVEALAAYLSQDQIADYLGVSRPTFAALMERDPEISLRYKRGKAKAISDVAQGLLIKARSGDTASAIFYLKTQAGWRETNHVDHTSSDGSMTPQAATQAWVAALARKHADD